LSLFFFIFFFFTGNILPVNVALNSDNKNLKRRLFQNINFKDRDLTVSGQSFITITNEIVTEITKLFSRNFHAYGPIKSFSK